MKNLKFFLLILFLIISSIHSSNVTNITTGEEFEGKTEGKTEEETEKKDEELKPIIIENSFKSDIKYLMNICITDDVCKFLYHIDDDYKNYTVFIKIVLPYYNRLGRNLNNCVNEINSIYNNDNDNNEKIITETFKRKLILFQMIKNGIENGIFCGQNQIVHTYSDGSMACVCEASSDCNTPQTTLTALYYLFGVAIFGIAILIIVYFVKNHQIFSFISSKISGSKK